MKGAVVGEHLLISLVPWLLGMAVGGGLGYVCALGVHSLSSTVPGLRRVLILVPGRAVAVTLPLLYPLVPVIVGLGRVAVAVMVGLFVLIFALLLTVVTLLEHWYPSPLVVRLIAGARTLATASIAVAAAASLVGGSGGAGVVIFQGMRLLDYSQMLRGLSTVVLLALVIDVLLGTVQLLFYRTGRDAEPMPSATG